MLRHYSSIIWNQFISINQFYHRNSFKYNIMKNGFNFEYKEYYNKEEIFTISFDIVEWKILQLCNTIIVDDNKVDEFVSKNKLTKHKFQKIINKFIS